jgi:hypothetical protein
MKTLRAYEPPKITSLTSEEILDLMGPAQAMGSEEFIPGADQGGGDMAGGGSRRRVGSS